MGGAGSTTGNFNIFAGAAAFLAALASEKGRSFPILCQIVYVTT